MDSLVSFLFLPTEMVVVWHSLFLARGEDSLMFILVSFLALLLWSFWIVLLFSEKIPADFFFSSDMESKKEKEEKKLFFLSSFFLPSEYLLRWLLYRSLCYHYAAVPAHSSSPDQNISMCIVYKRVENKRRPFLSFSYFFTLVSFFFNATFTVRFFPHSYL